MEFDTLVNPPQEVFDQVVKLTSETEDWNFREDDYTFWKINYDQFWLVTVVEKGTTNFAASVSLARWDGPKGSLYSIGMFYCVEKYRGQGLGKPIFKQVMDIVGDTNATLTGAVKMSAKYDKVFGFDKYPEHWHYLSTVKCADLVRPEKASERYITKVWTDVDYEALTAYDRMICVRDRKQIMTAWFNLEDTFTRVVIEKSSGKICGYTTIRTIFGNRLSPAPFYADNLKAAEVLLKDTLNMIPNWQQYNSLGFVWPGCNQDALSLLEMFTMNKDSISTGKFCRSQFTKELIPTPDHKVYSLMDYAHQFV